MASKSLESFDGIAVIANTADTSDVAPPPTCRFWGSARMTYTACATIAMCLHLCMRNTLNFVILCMVQPTGELDGEYSSAMDALNSDRDNNNEWRGCDVTIARNETASGTVVGIMRTGELTWSRQQEISLLGTFFYGYVITLPFAGRLADAVGGKALFVHSITLQSLVYMLLPICARFSYAAAASVRVLQGLIAGCSNPALYQLFSTWAHPTERTALLTTAYAGYSMGALVAFPLSGFFCSIGWPLAFYVVGGVSLVFGIGCHWLVYNTLDEHPRLSRQEHDYLRVAQHDATQSPGAVPWQSIVTSLPVWAFVLTHIFHTYGVTMLAIMMPRYLKEAMGFSLSQAGVYAAAPFLGGVAAKGFTIVCSSILEKRKHMNLTLYRRILYVICNTITVLLLLGAIYADCQLRTFVVILLLGVGAFSDIGFSAAYWPSLMFVAPSYTGLLSGFANCLATCSGFIIPFIIASLVTGGTENEWDNVLFTVVIASSIGTFVYGLWGSSKLQHWDQSATGQETTKL